MSHWTRTETDSLESREQGHLFLQVLSNELEVEAEPECFQTWGVGGFMCSRSMYECVTAADEMFQLDSSEFVLLMRCEMDFFDFLFFGGGVLEAGLHCML